jgi:hypothetical protein
MGLGDIVWGKMYDHGIISCFHVSSDFDKRFAGQSQHAQKNINCNFLSLHDVFLSTVQRWEASILLGYRI